MAYEDELLEGETLAVKVMGKKEPVRFMAADNGRVLTVRPGDIMLEKSGVRGTHAFFIFRRLKGTP